MIQMMAAAAKGLDSGSKDRALKLGSHYEEQLKPQCFISSWAHAKARIDKNKSLRCLTR